MLVTFRLLVFALAGAGFLVGVAFGLGVAYGKGDPKTVNSGLTQQQIAALVGGTGAGGGGGAQTTGTARAGSTSVAGGGGAGNSTTGQITAVDAQSMTVQTAQGAVKVNLAANTTIQTLTTGKATDLKVGDSIVVAGTRGSDGSVAATSVSAIPATLQGQFSGGGATQRPPVLVTP